MNYIAKLIKQDLAVLWYPAILLILLLFLMAVFYLWGRKYFRNDYSKDTDQVKPYNSGNLDEVNYNIKSSNLYWGFKKSIEGYFDRITFMHDGDLNDYIKWLIIVMAVCFLLVGGGIL